jgi:two-component system, NtrC family, response regulator AtoC
MAPNTIEPLRLLIVSREMAVVRLLGSLAESNSWHLETAHNGWDGMERVQSGEAPNMLVLDIPRGDTDSLYLLPWLRRLRPDLPILVLCHKQDAGTEKEAVRLGAKHVLVRPLNEVQLELLIQRHLGSSHDHTEVEMASEDVESLGEHEYFLGVSPIMQKLRTQAKLLAQTDVPVLILGEPGSGKSTVARLIHKLSVYSGFKFLKVNCAEMPAELLEIELFGKGNTSGALSSASLAKTSPGKLEIAEKGTLFIDEITEMPLGLQVRLLQVLQEKRFVRSVDGEPVEVDVRIIAASSGDVDRALAEKRLRTDLYYRLSVFTVHVPPLRQRKEEIKVLLRYSMHKLARYYGRPPREFSPSVLAACQSHNWPGNLQELDGFVKRYLVAGDRELSQSGLEPIFENSGNRLSGQNLARAIAAHDEVEAGASTALPKSLKSLIQSVKWEAERNAIAAALEKTGWNRKAAARLLEVSYRTLLYKIGQYHMNASEPCLSSFPEMRLARSDQSKSKRSVKAS